MIINERIVAEISKTWPEQSGSEGILLSRAFEDVIRKNRDRGFRLESWQMTSVTSLTGEGDGDRIYETIIAVFVKGE